jgi:hypothetical protein
MAALIFLLFNLGALLFKSKSRLEAENAALRQQLVVLQVAGRGSDEGGISAVAASRSRALANSRSRYANATLSSASEPPTVPESRCMPSTFGGRTLTLALQSDKASTPVPVSEPYAAAHFAARERSSSQCNISTKLPGRSRGQLTSEMGLGRVKRKSDLVVMPSGRQIFAFVCSPHDHRAQKSGCGYTA